MYVMSVTHAASGRVTENWRRRQPVGEALRAQSGWGVATRLDAGSGFAQDADLALRSDGCALVVWSEVTEGGRGLWIRIAWPPMRISSSSTLCSHASPNSYFRGHAGPRTRISRSLSLRAREGRISITDGSWSWLPSGINLGCQRVQHGTEAQLP